MDDDSTFRIDSPARKVRRSSVPDSRPNSQQPGYSYIFASDNVEYHDSHRKQYSIHQKQGAAQDHAKGRLNASAADSTEDRGRIIPKSATPQTNLAAKVANSTSSSGTASNTGEFDTPPQLEASSYRRASESRDPWYYPLSDEACRILHDFHGHFMPLFPFVVLPANITHEELRRDRPLLWKAIMMQGLYFNARRQVAMGDELLNSIVSTAFLESQKSLDLLQALEILIAWSVHSSWRAAPGNREANKPFSRFYMSSKSFQLTNLLFLSRSICVSLGFNESQEFSKQQDHTAANLEQMRAFAGVYYLVVSPLPTMIQERSPLQIKPCP